MGRILVVDDDETIASSLARFLARDGEVVALTSAREALRRIVAGERFDAVVCNLAMPISAGRTSSSASARPIPRRATRSSS